MKILDISQTASSVSYTLLSGLFELKVEVVPILLREAFSLSILYFMLDSSQVII